jgi:hypothetical protein
MLAYIEPVVVKLAQRVPDLNDEEESLLSAPRAKESGSTSKTSPKLSCPCPRLEAFPSSDLLGSQDNTTSPQPSPLPSTILRRRYRAVPFFVVRVLNSVQPYQRRRCWRSMQCGGKPTNDRRQVVGTTDQVSLNRLCPIDWDNFVRNLLQLQWLRD